jgi:hypothetical protein
MGKIENVEMRQPTPGPGLPRSPKEALHANPTEVLVVGKYTTKRSAREAAGRVNLGARAEWPNHTYYAAWGFNDDKNQWEMWVGLRSHMPEGWRKFVEGYPKRRGAALSSKDSPTDQ